MERRRAMKLVHEFLCWEKIVSLSTVNGKLFISTNIGVYQFVDGKLVPVDIVYPIRST